MTIFLERNLLLLRCLVKIPLLKFKKAKRLVTNSRAFQILQSTNTMAICAYGLGSNICMQEKRVVGHISQTSHPVVTDIPIIFAFFCLSIRTCSRDLIGILTLNFLIPANCPTFGRTVPLWGFQKWKRGTVLLSGSPCDSKLYCITTIMTTKMIQIWKKKKKPKKLLFSIL